VEEIEPVEEQPVDTPRRRKPPKDDELDVLYDKI
jgi:hypothetical protein